MIARASDSSTESCFDRHPASFRDPSGFVYRAEDGQLLRQVNTCYQPTYELFKQSGLYEELASDGLLVDHEEVPLDLRATNKGVLVLRPRELPFITYPYEWAFSALKDAALLTLDVQSRAMNRGLVLKDASAYNVQFNGTSPIFVDTLSFGELKNDEPWAAYGQFCRHFLAPLALMACSDARLNGLLRIHIDGVPLDMAARLLPWRSRLSLSLLIHVFWHAHLIRRHGKTDDTSSRRSSKSLARLSYSVSKMHTLIDSLRDFITGLSWTPDRARWLDYYEDNSYSQSELERKASLVDELIGLSQPQSAWDFGANTGRFSRLCEARGIPTLALDMDASCVERNYLSSKERDGCFVTPLFMDLANPSPSLGWKHNERDSLLARGPCDLGMALALIHHLAISNNVPFRQMAEFFHAAAKSLIIEWVPKTDQQLQRLLQGREDIFIDYNEEHFRQQFGQFFKILKRRPLGDTGRVLYFMQRL